MTPGPVQERQRILALDLLRGWAVLGILVMNIQSFTEIFAAYRNSPRQRNLWVTDAFEWRPEVG